MQARIREGVRDRTQVLAAIAHDLQTPLTRLRLRLRLEQVADTELRDRLTADLAATQRLVREGLDLARAGESREPFSQVDIDSLISSLVEDSAEFGAPVTFVGGCSATVRVKPDALARCLGNLVENALKYGGDAELACARQGGAIIVTVRDHGSGIPSDAMAAMFQPFQRGDQSRSRITGGTGIGLTIAQAQANTFGGVVTLANHPKGGLIATVTFVNA
ncbi:ATP-binding protein [Sphingomonas sp. PB2P12]|uniref:sensor histidine kinase n=1 Tax=Sphingomonas sandaracina TaxID=3096157 RepID=UPI002FC78296